MKRILIGFCILISLHSLAQNQIGATGNVGIGTTSPLQRLHVANGEVLLQNTTPGYTSLNIKNFDGSKTLYFDYAAIFQYGGNCTFRVPGYDLVLNDADGGNVAIGTTNPKGYKLAVNGSAIFTSATVKLYANWPDYVFKRDYRLLPLPELEEFIKQNNHLPEMPSAAEVEKNGLNLGENQAALLKKIEELTLYIIEQDKQIKDMKSILEDLTKKQNKQ